VKGIELSTTWASQARSYSRRLLLKTIFGWVLWMIPGPNILATNFFSTVTAGPGQTVTLNPGDTVTVTGTNQEGIVAIGTGILNASGVTVTTSGDNGSGAAAHAGGRLTIISTASNSSAVMTSGIGAFGLLSSGIGSGLLTDGITVGTTGANSHGVLVREGALLTLQNSNVTTSGSGAAGLAVIPGQTAGSTLISAGSIISTTGAAAPGLLISGRAPAGPTNIVILDGTRVTTQQGDGINWDAQSNTNITLRNATTVLPGDGVLFRGGAGTGSGTPRALNLTATGNVSLQGDILAGTFSVVNVSLLRNSTLTGAIQGINDLTIESGSTWHMTDSSNVLGNVSLTSGNLLFESVKKFASTGEASVLSIGGNFRMDSGSTLSLGIGGVNGEQYDHVQVQRDGSLNGTLAVFSLDNFRPVDGNAFEILHTGGTRSGRFATINDSLNTNPNLERIDIYAPNGVALVYVAAAPTPIPPGPTPTPAPSPTPKPPIDVEDPKPLPPVDPEAPLELPEVLSILDPTVEQLTAVYEIGFSGANTQRFKLDERFADIQQGSRGFVSDIPNPPAPSGGKEVVGQGKAPPPVFQPTPQNRWGVWANGWGDWVTIDNDGQARGYNFTTGGFIIGIDYRVTDHFAVGLMGSYAYTRTNLQPSGDIDVNTGRGGLYATYFDRGFYADGAVYGGHNTYNTSRQGLLGEANGSTSGGELSTWGETGYDFHFGDFKVGPLAAFQYTYVSISGFNEHGSLLPLQIHSDSQDSFRTDFGLRASYAWHVGRSVLLIPSLMTAWEHEYKYSVLPITVSSSEFPGIVETISGPSEGHDSAIINLTLQAQWTPKLSTFVGYQGQLGRDRYNANAVTGGLSFSF